MERPVSPVSHETRLRLARDLVDLLAGSYRDRCFTRQRSADGISRLPTDCTRERAPREKVA